MAYQIEVSVRRVDSEGPWWYEVGTAFKLSRVRFDWDGHTVDIAGTPLFLALRWIAANEDRAIDSLPGEVYRDVITAARKKYGPDEQDKIPKPGEVVRVRERVLLPQKTVFVFGEAKMAENRIRIGPRAALPLLVAEGTRQQFFADLNANHQDLPAKFL